MAEEYRNITHTAPSSRKPILERLAKLKTAEFYGRNEDDAVAAEFWLDRTQRVLEQLEATPGEGFTAAVSLLQEDAYDWWKTVVGRLGQEQRTWEHFSELFREKYIGRIHMEKMRKKFLGLKQNQLSVSEYERDFLRYSKYAKELVAVESEKCRRFEDGLNEYLKFPISGLMIDNFPRLVASALRYEQSRKEFNERREQSAKRGQSSQEQQQQQSKKFKGKSDVPSGTQQGSSEQNAPPVYSSVSVPSEGQRSRAPVCDTCQRPHYGVCKAHSSACYGCGEVGHIKRFCPKNSWSQSPAPSRSTPSVQKGKNPPSGSQSSHQTQGDKDKQESRASARVYAIQAREEAEDPDIIVGIVST